MTPPRSRGLQPAQSPTPPKPPKTPRILKALEGVWEMLPDEARQEMTKVGFRPPVAAEPTAEEALLTMLQQHEEELPQEIQKMIQARVSGPPPSATEVEIKATNDLKGASGRLRDLGHKKIRLQGRIDEVKAVLTGLYAEMKDLLQELQEAEAKMESLAQGAEDMDIEELEQGRKTIMEQLEIKRRRIQAGGQQARPNSGSSKDGGNKNPDNQDRSRSPKAKP